MKTQTLRHVAFACLALLACALLAAPAHAQPSQIKIVVPYTPGSGPDILSRLMANEIGRAQGLTVLVENRPGGENREDDYIRPLRGVCLLEPSPPQQRVSLRHRDLRLERLTLLVGGAIDAT